MLRFVKQGMYVLFVAAIPLLSTPSSLATLIFEISGVCKNATRGSSRYAEVVERASVFKRDIEDFYHLMGEYKKLRLQSWKFAQKSNFKAANKKLKEADSKKTAVRSKGWDVTFSYVNYLGLLSELCPEHYYSGTYKKLSI